MFSQYRLLFLLSFLFMGSCSASPPAGDLIQGKLRPCPDKPNCVNSERAVKDDKFIQPLSYSGQPNIAWQHLENIITGLKGEIIRKDEQYLWAIFRSELFNFIDDTEFRLDRTNRLIHIRSGARTGYSDMGVNRNRVQKIKKEFVTLQNKITEYSSQNKRYL